MVFSNFIRQSLVLVLDDEPLTVELFLEFLQALGCDSIGSLSGADTLKLAESRHPQLILLDIMMPEMNGLEVLQRLKRNPATKSIPVLMITAQQKGQDIETAFNLGAAGYVMKPIQRDEFKKKVKETLAASGYSSPEPM